MTTRTMFRSFGIAALAAASIALDPDNANRTDPETAIYLARDKDGRVLANDVSFRG